MKKSNLKRASILCTIGLFLFVLVFNSCSKHNESNKVANAEAKKSSKRISNVNPNLENVWINLNNLGTESEKKLAFNTLSIEEAKYCWLRHIETKTATMNLNNQQVIVVDQLVTLVNQLTDINESNEAYFKILETTWLTNAQNCFTINQIYSIGYTLDNNTNEQPGIASINYDANGGSCQCNTNSSVTCAMNIYKCGTLLSCKKRIKGCGFIWWSECNGMCQPA